MITSKATKTEIREASNKDLIICLVRMNSGSRMYKYEYKNAELIANELEQRGIVIAADLFEEYKKVTQY